jgi:hypothetical protein
MLLHRLKGGANEIQERTQPSVQSTRTQNDSMILFPRFRGLPAPAFVIPSWQLTVTQPSQVLAHSEPIAPILIQRFVLRTARQEA